MCTIHSEYPRRASGRPLFDTNPFADLAGWAQEAYDADWKDGQVTFTKRVNGYPDGQVKMPYAVFKMLFKDVRRQAKEAHKEQASKDDFWLGLI